MDASGWREGKYWGGGRIWHLPVQNYNISLEPCSAFRSQFFALFFSFECLSSKVNNNKNYEMVSDVLNSCLRDQKASAKPLELSNPKGRSCLSGEVLAAETLEISGVEFFYCQNFQ